MDKPEYSDLYKFIVSLGVILIAFAVLLPWLFLRESFDSLINTTELATLTPTAQALITHRQNLALWFVQNIIWISALPAILGFTCLVSGIFLWQRKQRLTDTKDELETEKLRLEVKSMLPQQIAVKLIEEAASETSGKHDEPVEVKEQIKVINDYARMEQIVFNKLADCFGTANVRQNLQIQDSAADALVKINRSDRAIVEIKYYRRPTNLRLRISDIGKALFRSVQSYKAVAPYHITYGIGLLILSEEATRSSGTFDEITSLTVVDIDIRVITISESRFINLECSEFRAMISIGPESK